MSVFYRQHIFAFVSISTIPGIFKLFTFRVTIEIVGLIFIITVFYSLYNYIYNHKCNIIQCIVIKGSLQRVQWKDSNNSIPIRL